MTTTENQTQLELYFQKIENIIGIDQGFCVANSLYWLDSKWPFVSSPLLRNELAFCLTQTQTETTVSELRTKAYHRARHIIKKRADENDIIHWWNWNDGCCQSIPAYLSPENLKDITIPAEKRPIVFISHMEHHSNQTSWLETIADVVVIPLNRWFV
jgi:hypothetical protein